MQLQCKSDERRVAMYLERTLERHVREISDQFPVLLVTGARQVGKTTLLTELSGDERKIVTLDDPLNLNLARQDPALFMQKYTPPVIIDEIQYAPEILPYIKMAADRERNNGMFWLTGSQQFQMMHGISESLAGRVGILNLLGLSRREITGKGIKMPPFLPTPGHIAELERAETATAIKLKELYRLIWRGSYPKVGSKTTINRQVFYDSYLQTYLQRDVRDLANVGDLSAFTRFIRAAAARTAQLLNLTDLARDADIAVNTAKSWLSVLQASGIIYLLEPYHTNFTKRLFKTPKLYFLDTGLCSYLTDWLTPETLESGAMTGAILETWIFGELLKSYLHNGQRAPFYFYRDKDKKEADLLIVQDGVIYPLEFKKTASPSKHDISVFKTLKNLDKPIGPGALICLTEKTLPLTEEHQAIPVSLL